MKNNNKMPTNPFLEFTIKALSSAFAAAVITPAVTAIDLGVMQSSLEKSKFKNKSSFSLIGEKLLRYYKHPVNTIVSPAGRAVFLLYFGTYVLMTVADGLIEGVKKNPEDVKNRLIKALPKPISEYVSTKVCQNPGFVAAAVVSSWNVTACIAKDMRLATIVLGSASSKGLPTIGFFGCRDYFTNYAATKGTHEFADVIKKHARLSDTTALNCGQFFSCVGVQTMSTPIHLLGVRFALKESFSRRMMKNIGRQYFSATFFRMGRIIPSFVFGPGLNRTMLDVLSGRLNKKMTPG